MKNTQTIATVIAMVLFLPLSSACVHKLTLQSVDGEKLQGRYRFARENTALVDISGSDGEAWSGKFADVARVFFIESYEQVFGRGSIAVDGPDVSAYGNAFAGMVGSSYALTDSAFEAVASTGTGTVPNRIKGPLFYWTAVLSGSRGSIMNCYLIGSSSTGGGFGRCRSHAGKEYTVEF